MMQVIWCFLHLDAFILTHGSLILLETTHDPMWKLELNSDQDGPGSTLRTKAYVYFERNQVLFVLKVSITYGPACHKWA